MRMILFTGKGGVGKTTVACATALDIAASGRKTLIMSTDPAHSLADAFGVELRGEPIEVLPNLWAEQIEPQARLEENWRVIQQHAVAVLSWAGIGDIEAEELSLVPGLDEIFSLADVKRHHDAGFYDAVIVDCAPTGETLRLLSLPDVIQWYIERIFPVERRVVGALRPMAKRITSFPLPDERVYVAIKRFYDRLDGVRNVLTDSRYATVRLVVNPERMVIAEARRTFTYLGLFGYRVDAVVANRLLPPQVSDPYFARWKEIQSEHMTTIEQSFAPVPILKARLHPHELSGPDSLRALGDELYQGFDPAGILYDDDPLTIARSNGAYVLALRMPFVDRRDVELCIKEDELSVKVGGYRRMLVLPAMLAGREAVAARLDSGTLRITFEGAGDKR